MKKAASELCKGIFFIIVMQKFHRKTRKACRPILIIVLTVDFYAICLNQRNSGIGSKYAIHYDAFHELSAQDKINIPQTVHAELGPHLCTEG